jgi:hypothetical protein
VRRFFRWPEDPRRTILVALALVFLVLTYTVDSVFSIGVFVFVGLSVLIAYREQRARRERRRSG